MVRFDVSVNVALGERLGNRQRDASRALEEAVLSSCEPFVPYRTGRLCKSGRAVGDGRVVWAADYARDCYYAGRPFSRKVHPRACARWFEAAKGECLGQWKAAVADKMIR